LRRGVGNECRQCGECDEAGALKTGHAGSLPEMREGL
jgi:hypothetical protein